MGPIPDGIWDWRVVWDVSPEYAVYLWHVCINAQNKH